MADRIAIMGHGAVGNYVVTFLVQADEDEIRRCYAVIFSPDNSSDSV